MANNDDKRTSFHTSPGVYCYTKMPFGLKNAGATYQRLVDNAFEGQVGRNLEVYVDDLVIKSHTEDELVRDIKVTPHVQNAQEVYEEGSTSVGLQQAEEAFALLKQHIAALPTLVAPRPGSRNGEADPVISKPDASGRLQKWSVLLGEHNISYRPRTAVKGQILADFLIEKPETDAVLPQSEVKLQEQGSLFTDMARQAWTGRAAGLHPSQPGRNMEFTYALRFEFTATNNEAEYEALIAGLRIAARMGVRNLEANVDSRLVANHVLGEYVAKEDNMIQYLDKTNRIHKLRAPIKAGVGRNLEEQIHLGDGDIYGDEKSMILTWMTPIIEFISKGTLPHEQKDARRIRRTAQNSLSNWCPHLRSTTICSSKEPYGLGTTGPPCTATPRDKMKRNAMIVQTNGLVERANRSLGEGIKARLDRHKGRWVEELSHVLWAHRTTIKVSTGDTPFSLVYGTEAVIPAEIGMPTIRTAECSRGVSFRPGDFVYRANDASHAEDTGKLGPKWEGPYEVTEALGKGAYKLRDMDGREVATHGGYLNHKNAIFSEVAHWVIF
ncbi:reverse transcriptase domain-containing protein [Tanacetum coccineum]